MAVPTSFLSDIRNLARFRTMLRKLLRASELAARKVGLTPQQHQLLLCVAGLEKEQGLPIFRIAQLLQVRHHSAVELIDRAEQEGLVMRETDPEDPRRVLVKITPMGMRKLRRLAPQHRKELQFMRAYVSLEPLVRTRGAGLEEQEATIEDDEE